MKKAFNIIGFIFLVIITSLTNVAYADLTTFNFTGTVNYTNGPIGLPNPFVGTFYIGQTFTGNFTFDSNAIGTNSWQPGEVDFDDVSYNNAISNYTIQFGNLYATFDKGGIRVINDSPRYEVPPEEGGVPTSFDDTYVVGAGRSYSANESTNIVIPNYYVKGFYMNFTDFTASMLDSTNLPVIPPDITNTFQVFTMNFGLTGGTAEANIHGKISSLSLAPEPISSLLFLTGGILLTGRKLLKRERSGK